MDILIPDEWLRKFIVTPASVQTIAEKLALCGPSVDRVTKNNGDNIYEIEITTNRIDSASVYGIAREAYAILPRFGISTRYINQLPKLKQKLNKNVNYLEVKVDHSLCSRFTAILIKNVKLKPSPEWMQRRLIAVNLRPINNVVDISNYIMHEVGQPVHTFDYDKIQGAKMVLRKSKKGEKLTTLDGNEYELPGGDIVIADGSGKLIDLAGIMGGLNSAVDENTKNVLLFVQTYNPVVIRKTSMSLPKRTEAVELFEKGIDPELVSDGIALGINLFEKLTNGKAESKILDLYPNPYKTNVVVTSHTFIEKLIGVKIDKNEISRVLFALGFKGNWKSDELTVEVPSFRANDVQIPEDIVEEIARIYGYHNLPSDLMEGKLPLPQYNSIYDFEYKLKLLLKSYSANEIYSLSLVPKEYVDEKSLKLINPLGSDSEYLRNSLRPTLIAAAEENKGNKEAFHLFEIANTYTPITGELPNELMTLAGIFSNYDFRKAKGIIETLLKELHIKADFVAEDGRFFVPSKRVIIGSGAILGEFGELEKNGFIYYEFQVEKLFHNQTEYPKLQKIPKYPAQIEDITLMLPQKTKVAEVMQGIKNSDKRVVEIELTDIFNNAFTFRVRYQDSEKTLNDKEVESIRTTFIHKVKSEFGAQQKE